MRTSAWPEPLPIGNVGGAWVFPEQGVIYTESRARAPSAEDVDALFDFFDWLVPHVPTAHSPTLIHDWRTLRRVPREARTAFVWRRRKVAQEPARVIVALDVNPILRMTIQTVSMGAQLLVRAAPLDVVTDPTPSMRERGATDPDPNLQARLRLAWVHSRG